MAEQDDDTILSKLYEASMEGSLDKLNSLIENDRLILNKISLTPFSETPLHISSLLGHVHFIQRLVALQPSLASLLDSNKRSPLHLAAANGHTEAVKALMLSDQGMCSVRDFSGKIPLHYAAMRGHVGPIEILVSAAPSSVFEAVSGGGETVLHLSVRYNHLEALKMLVRFTGQDNSEFLNMKEQDYGNSALHLAVILNQTETVKYLLSLPGVNEDTLNHKGFKASEMADHFPRDFDNLRLRHILGDNHRHRSVNIDNTDGERIPITPPGREPRWKWVPRSLRALYRAVKMRGDEMRGSIMVVATLIAQITFQSAVNPPGGVWQNSETSDKFKDFKCSEKNPCIAGTAIRGYAKSEEYLNFVMFNNVSFLGSLSAILLVLGGFPLRNGICIWLMTIDMCVTLTCMALTFWMGMSLVTPTVLEDNVFKITVTSFLVLGGLLALLGLLHTLFILVWLVKTLCQTRLFLISPKDSDCTSMWVFIPAFEIGDVSTSCARVKQMFNLEEASGTKIRLPDSGGWDREAGTGRSGSARPHARCRMAECAQPDPRSRVRLGEIGSAQRGPCAWSACRAQAAGSTYRVRAQGPSGLVHAPRPYGGWACVRPDPCTVGLVRPCTRGWACSVESVWPDRATGPVS